MLKKIQAEDVYLGDYGWHTGRFHFSFADYVDVENGPFGVLEAFNDFNVDIGKGFETHPHQEMEIISYCIAGELEHEDSQGNKNILRGGDAQYMCAGSGVTHSERNATADGFVRFLQVWIKPDQKTLTPQYSFRKKQENSPRNMFHLVACGKPSGSAIVIHQDASISIADLEAQSSIRIDIHAGRQAYLYCLEGSLAGFAFDLLRQDAVKLWGKEDLAFTAREDSSLMLIEMAA